MLVIIIYTILSFILDNIMTTIFPSFLSNISAFTTIYIVVALSIIFPYFNNKKKYFIILLVFGIMFDIIYTSSFPLNTLIFILLGIEIGFLNNIFPENIFGSSVISVISIISFHILSFISLSIVGYINYGFIILFRIIVNSLIMTILYSVVSYFLIKKIMERFNIKQIK